MTILQVRIVAVLIGALLGSVIMKSCHPPKPQTQVISPLKVEILDDGGANLTVESTVVESETDDKSDKTKK